MEKHLTLKTEEHEPPRLGITIRGKVGIKILYGGDKQETLDTQVFECCHQLAVDEVELELGRELALCIQNALSDKREELRQHRYAQQTRETLVNSVFDSLVK